MEHSRSGDSKRDPASYETDNSRTIEVRSRYAGVEKERQTTAAMERREPLIYSARIRADDLLGDPDLLRLEGDRYVAGDIESA
jgi:hypothetical protein